MIDQIKALRKLSGEQRLEIAFRLSAITKELALANIKITHPKATKKELVKLFRERLDTEDKRSGWF